MNRLLLTATAAALVAAGTVVAVADSKPPAWDGLRAGVAVVDASWHVGAGAGQYSSDQNPSLQDEWDPNFQHTKQASSYGVQSRLSIRAIVLQSPGGDPVALVKDDNYLAQDLLTRRVGQLLAHDGSKVTYDHLLLSASHDHNSPYYSTPTWGLWLFQDVMDLRMFEYQARHMAKAIETAERAMRPARMGATTVQFPDFQGNIAGNGVNEDGTPTGYPVQDNDHGLVVMRFDDMTNPEAPKPLATWVNYAEHGESLDGYNLFSADWLGPFERYVDRATGVPVVFSQGAVGSAEGPYEDWFARGHIPTTTDGGDTVYKVWAHMGYAQAERGTHLLAQRVLAAWRAIGDDDADVQVPPTNDPPVKMLTHWVAGPVSHPYPAVSNCRTGRTVNGDPGAPVLGLPDCARADQAQQLSPLWQSLKATGLPIPDNYDFTGFTGAEENLRLKLQAVRIGGVLLASCACEPQSDLIRALETRTDKTPGNRWNGFDYANPAHVAEGWPGLSVEPCHPTPKDPSVYDCPNPGDVSGKLRLTMPKAAFDHMEAEINNPADGWDDPAYAAQANSEPTDLTQIKGNFTSHELDPSCGYALPVGLGHTGDYNGYTVSYREFMARDSYRKALTSYGPHTADYMVTRLMAMAANLSCGTPVPSEPTDPIAVADEQRQQAEAIALGQLSSFYYDTWDAQIPDSAGTPAPLNQPQDVTRFDAATFSWVGGDNWTDNPAVRVERRQRNGRWATYADQSGEVQLVLQQPGSAVTGALDYRTGAQSWTWTASFEAFDSYPRADVPGGQVPDGDYRFVVDGFAHQGGKPTAYHLMSRTFTVSPWTGLQVNDLRVDPSGSVSFDDEIAYPRLPLHVPAGFRFYADDGGGKDGGGVLCKTCTFRPWATSGHVASAVVTVVSATGQVRTVDATYDASTGRWHTDVVLGIGDRAFIDRGGVHDTYGEFNGAPSATVTRTV